jgi:glutamate dehydrogenase (NAD(P)+)
MMDEYSTITGTTSFGVVTGKPITLGGSEGRHDATARGGWMAIREAAQQTGMDLNGATVAIQGFGNVGYNAALCGKDFYGCSIVAVSDSKGGIYRSGGFDPRAVMAHKENTGSVVGFPGGEDITNAEILELEVDILIPAALENVITRNNADAVRARIIAEFANGPTTKEADQILDPKGIHIIPDFLCNGGGVIVSYFEMVQNFNMDHWPVEEVYQRLDKKMTTAYHKVAETAQHYNVGMRQAAYSVAVERVVLAMQGRGWV